MLTLRGSKQSTAQPPVFRILSLSSSSLLKLVFSTPIVVRNKPTDDFMMHPLNYISIEVIKNPLSSYIDDLSYIESGNLLSVSVKKFLP